MADKRKIREPDKINRKKVGKIKIKIKERGKIRTKEVEEEEENLANAQLILIGARYQVIAVARVVLLLKADAERFGPIRVTEPADELYLKSRHGRFA